jgi:replication-associated recombination protein RarA
MSMKNSMVTFLIISKNQTLREAHAIELLTKQNIHQLDISFLETEGSIGIEDIRNFQKQIMLKPGKGKNKAAIIKNAQNLTREAQNALLKTLEEPPNNTYIFLTAETENTFLPTILSRTSIVKLQEEQFFDENSEEIRQQLQNLMSESIGDKLKLAETLSADKTLSINWIEKAIHILREDMLTQQAQSAWYIEILNSLQKTYSILKTTNVNPRFALEHLFLSLG